jgi:acetoin utilization protein AcuB
MKRSVPTVADYMTRTPHSIGADQPVSRAHLTMRQHRIRHLPVLAAGRLVGIVTERDLSWIDALDDAKRETIVVEDAMTPFPYVTEPTTPLDEVAATMGAGKFGAAIVAEGHKVVGVFTTTDAMRALADALHGRFPGEAGEHAA